MTQPRIVVERDVEVAMRDGTILRANVYRPEQAEQMPVLLQRTPYGKDGSDVAFCMLSAARGYAVVVQDTRGRWASDGVHYPMRDEFDDGYDTVEWAARQPWANGKVGMWGGSYVGWTQWTAAASKAPSLVAIYPEITFTDTYGDCFCPAGALALGVAVSWGLGSVASMAIQRLDVSPEERAQWMEELADALDGMAKGGLLRTLPLTDMPLLSRPEIGQAFLDIFAHREYDGFWAPMDVRRHLQEISIPAFNVGGWYDIFAQATVANYCQMRAAGHQGKLLMGPWLHGPVSGVVGEADFGVRAGDMFVLSYELRWRWFDYWLKGIDNGIVDEPPVRIFLMGRNTWRDEQEWPLARTVYTPCYLHSDGAANTLRGDGVLSLTPQAAEPPDHYVYDPKDPVPTRGGGLCCSAAALPAGPYDQRKVEERQDVLVYTSAPLEEELEVTGPVQVILHAATSAVDTDFTAKLVDVGVCGYARNVCDGIVRARYRHGSQAVVLLTPGEVEEFTISLGPTANVFMPGHRVRLEVSSSNFPHYDRNSNTGQVPQSEEDQVSARQTIYHDKAHPSRIVLPVIPPS
jgi:uncharacterized protein